MSLRNTISEAQKVALKQGDTQSLAVLRMLWSAIRNTEIESRNELNDEHVLQVISRQVKQLKDSLSDFQKANRKDLEDQTQWEIDFLSQYLPQQLSDQELEQRVRVTLSNLQEQKNIGMLMGVIMKEVQGKADGKRIRECLEKIISQQ